MDPVKPEAVKPRTETEIRRVEAPAITLPRGGGAIRSIGEKVASSPSGAATLSVPIKAPKARGGFGPSLDLQYDSGAGNGPFGLGWQLRVPVIARKTDIALPRYQDEIDSDIFLLTGSEDLTPQLDPPAWQPKREERTLANGRTFEIRFYRPRIEGLYARIERWTDRATGESHWRTISHDNITTLYGTTPESRIVDPRGPTRVFSWHICESFDDKGNVILYRYKHEDSASVDTSQPCERNRTDVDRGANRYLKRVCYGNRLPYSPGEDLRLRTDWMFEVLFDYGEHYDEDADGQPTLVHVADDQRPWRARTDPFSQARAGFEVRTYRLCRHILILHRFPELGDAPRLTRVVRLGYREQPAASFLEHILERGIGVRADGSRFARSLPPLEVTYREARIDPTVRTLDAESAANLAAGVDGDRWQWADLDSEGLTGIVTEQGGAWFYKRNLGDGRLDAVTPQASQPAASLATAQLVDLAGDGTLDLAVFAGASPGFYERRPPAAWGSFTAFKTAPTVSWTDPNLRFIDLTGGGRADLLLAGDDVFTWHESLGEDGFGPAQRVPLARDEEQGPRVLFADPTQSTHLGDMNGDGLVDLIRIRNGEVCYWPSLGYARFGPKISMPIAAFDSADQFDAQRIRLADIDGIGVLDLIYLGRDAVQIYFNESGNGWSAPTILRDFPAVDDLSRVTTADLLANGTTCLVWSSPLPSDAQQPLRYIDLTGGEKPHLLIQSTNNMGSETRVAYAPSTRFYVADRDAGRPWVSRLPFPVHVVERVEVLDRSGRNRYVSHFAYHHGHFDGVEREFRGFGLVEQWDTEEIGTPASADPAANTDAASYLPPVRTCTWYHTGAYEEGASISRRYAGEYWRQPGQTPEDFESTLLADTTLPPDLTAREERAAARALKGLLLRQEVFAEDGSPSSVHPYTVSERSYEIRLIQPQRGNETAVFAVHARETLDFACERDPADPRLDHELTLEVDPFGNVRRWARASYGRLQPDPDLALADQQRQGQTWITYRESDYTDPVDQPDAWRMPIASDTRSYELTGLAAPPDGRHTLDTIRTAADDAVGIPYDATPDGSLQKRLIERERVLYRADDLSGALSLGQAGTRALPFETHQLAFTAGLVTQVFGDRVDADTLTAAGYVHSLGDADWWTSSGRLFYSLDAAHTPAEELAVAEQHFFLGHRFVDPFGASNVVEYDAHLLLPIRTEDAIGNTTVSDNDYVALQPRVVTDANGQRAAAAFDVFGHVAGTSVEGRNGEGDSLAGFDPDLDDAAIQAHLIDPLIAPTSLLASATSRVIYDLHAYYRTRDTPDPEPVAICTVKRRTHVSDLAPGDQTSVQQAFAYLDGFGQELQQKIPAESGPIDPGGPDVIPRWTCSGWKILNNKGRIVREFEPTFSATHRYQFALAAGAASTRFYDPLRRPSGTVYPNHTWEKRLFGTWRQEAWDVHDTALEADPRNDPQLGNHFGRLPEARYLPTWYEARRLGQLGAAEQSAAQKTAVHAATPNVEYVDAMGRPFLAISNNGPGELYQARTELDIEGHQRSITDALGRLIVRTTCDVLGRETRRDSMEAGTRWTLRDVAGKTVFAWDSRGHRRRAVYDALRRPTHVWIRRGDAPERLIERVVYGEGHPDSQPAAAGALNLRGRPWLSLDSYGWHWSTGVEPVVNEERGYDFKGNVLRSELRVAREFEVRPDWSAVEPLLDVSPLDPAAIAAAADSLVDAEVFASGAAFDALNRPFRVTLADGSDIASTFNQADLLERLQAGVRGGALADILASAEYNARGQRTHAVFGNGAHSTWEFDPLRFRLVHQQTMRGADRLQDLRYTYDATGNIVSMRDDAQQAIFFDNAVVEASADYTYDALYRLIGASGREHRGQLAAPQTDWRDAPRSNQSHPHDGAAMRRYTEAYRYDHVGNLLELVHAAANGNWTRTFTYDEVSQLEAATRSNRLTRASVGELDEPCTYDAHGNLTGTPHLTALTWDAFDCLASCGKGGGGMVHYVYDTKRQRARRVWVKAPGLIEDRLYLGAVEIFRVRNAAGQMQLERQTLHVADAMSVLALVESRTAGDDGSPLRLDRYRCPNYLDSTSLELDGAAQPISYEEFHPYGSTAYQGVRASLGANPKRYRYSGKERDEETGFTYHGARYYAPWLGRWTSADPLGTEQGANLYLFCRANPVNFSDPSGAADRDPTPQEIETLRRRGVTDPDTVRRLVNQKPPRARRPNERYAIDTYENQSRIRQPGRTGGSNIQGHHPIQDKWAKENVAGYRSGDATSQFLETGKGKEHTQITNDQRANRPSNGEWGEKSHSQARAEAVEQYKKADLLNNEKGGHQALMESDGHFFGLNDDVQINPDTGKPEVVKNARLAENLAEAEAKIASRARLARVGRSLARAGRFALAALPFIGIALGQASAAHAASQGDYVGAALDEAGFIPVAGDILDAGRSGVALGEAMDAGLGISDSAEEHGQVVERFVRSLGAEQDTAQVFGAIGAAGSAVAQGLWYMSSPVALPARVISDLF